MYWWAMIFLMGHKLFSIFPFLYSPNFLTIWFEKFRLTVFTMNCITYVKIKVGLHRLLLLLPSLPLRPPPPSSKKNSKNNKKNNIRLQFFENNQCILKIKKNQARKSQEDPSTTVNSSIKKVCLVWNNLESFSCQFILLQEASWRYNKT